MNQENVVFIVIVFFIAGHFSLIQMMLRQQSHLRRLDKKMDALLQHQGVEWPSLSPEVQLLAKRPNKKIVAIKLHREENPDMSIAEAKSEIEAFTKKIR